MSKLKLLQIPADFFPESISYVVVHKEEDVLSDVKLHNLEIELSNTIRSVSRRESFILGRKAAALALAKINISAAVTRGLLDEPVWPQGVVGSLTHSRDYAICAVSTDKEFAGLGLDLETSRKTFETKIAKRICSENELALLPKDEERAKIKLLKLFSAKEAFYKAVYPSLKLFLGFRDVELSWNADENLFEGWIINPKIKNKFVVTGKVTGDSFVISAAFLI